MLVFFTLAAAACVKEVICEPSGDPAKVNFLPANYTVGTKTPVSGGVFPTGESFGTFAFYSQDGTEWGTYMDNEQISYSAGDNKWLPSLDYYWPRRNKVSFLSYAPYHATTPWITSILLQGHRDDGDVNFFVNTFLAEAIL